MSAAAHKAISHLLQRIKHDPRLAYYFDPSTASMELLTAAHAEAHGLDAEAFRKLLYASLKFERPVCAECREALKS
jgi:hypothetical protein